MCQGVVVSLVAFKVANKTKRIVLSGIGSHADLFKDNKNKLIRAGWKGSVTGERIISIESDFSAWNKFTIESGEPSKLELKLLRDAYKRCAGNARTLINHVKRCKKIDQSLVNLLTEPALAEYEKVTEQAWAEYEKVTEQAWAECNKVTEPAWAEYNKVKEPAWIKLFSIKSNRVPHLQ